MVKVQLTPQAITKITQGATDFQPIVQIISINVAQEKSQNPNAVTRYRVVISDGELFLQGVIGGQLVQKIQSNHIRNFCVMRIHEYVCNSARGRTFVMLLNLTVLEYPNARIGNPQNFEALGSQPQAQQTPPQRAPPAPSYQQQQQQQNQQYQRQQQQPNRQQMSNQQQQSSSFKQENKSGFQQQQQQQPISFGRKMGRGRDVGPVVDLNNVSPQPIMSLNPYQNNWVIKARVVAKSEIREFNKGPDKSGKFFTIDLMDQDHSQIRAIFFNDLVNKYYDKLEVDGVYLLAKGNLQHANPKFSTIKNNFEIKIDNHTQIQAVTDDDSVPKMSHDYKRIWELDQTPNGALVDVLGAVHEVGDIVTFQREKEVKKRGIVLMDCIEGQPYSVEMALWGKQAQDCVLNPGDVVIVKGAKRSDYNGVSLGSLFSTQFVRNVHDENTENLSKWYRTGGANVENVAKLTNREDNPSFSEKRKLVPRKTFENIPELMDNEKPAPIKGTVTFIKQENLMYEACPTVTDPSTGRKCGKKVVSIEGGRFVCNACDVQHDYCDYRYIVSLVANDHAGSRWLTAFGKAAETILERPAEDLKALQDTDPDSFDLLLQQLNFKEYTLGIKVSHQENRMGATQSGGGDAPRVRCLLTYATPLDYTKESRRLLAEIDAYPKAQL